MHIWQAELRAVLEEVAAHGACLCLVRVSGAAHALPQVLPRRGGIALNNDNGIWGRVVGRAREGERSTGSRRGHAQLIRVEGVQHEVHFTLELNNAD